MESLFRLLTVLSLAGAVAPCLEETLEPEKILAQPFIEVTGNCTNDSFFQIELIPVESTLNVDKYNFSIVEQLDLGSLIELEDSNATQDVVYLSTHAKYFKLSGSVQFTDNQSLPFKVHYKEFPFLKNGTVISEAGNATKLGSLGPNEQFTYEFQNNPGDQFFGLTFSPQSLTSGFLAIRNGNGRISLMTSPTKDSFKVAVSANGTIIVDIITQTGRFKNASNVDYKIGYSVGHEDPTTSTPQPPTTTTPKQVASIKIFVLEVNAMEFYNQHVGAMQTDLRKALLDHQCNVTFSKSFECRHSCMMSDDPDRSCVAFEMLVAFSYFCKVTDDETLTKIVEGFLGKWEEAFQVDRIELNDCLTPAQKYWIPFAVGVPLVAMAFVLVGLAILKSFKAKKKQRSSSYSRMMSERNSRVSNGRRSRGNMFGNANQQFEFVD